MKHLSRMLLTAAMFFTASVLSAQRNAPEFMTLYKAGQPQAEIYLPAERNLVIDTAITELQTHLEAMTGKQIPVSDKEPKNFPNVGRPNQVQVLLDIRDKKEWEGKESPQGYTIIAGKSRQGRHYLIIRGNTSLALLYGVYDFLETLGVRFYCPGPDGTVIPEKRDIRIPLGERKVEPSVERRQMNYAGIDATHFDTTNQDVRHHIKDYTRWYLRNRLLINRNINSWEYPFIALSEGGSHGIAGAREKVKFEDEPERFPMVDGKRINGGQICWTNQKNADAAIHGVISFFERMDKEFSQNDLYYMSKVKDISLFDWGGALCECPDCTKAAGNDPNKLDRLVWYFMNKVAKEVAAKRPDGSLLIFAPYLQLTRPPDDVKIEPNIYTMACRSEAWTNRPEDQATYPFTKVYDENVRATNKAGGKLAVYDYVLWQGTPQPCDILDAVGKYKAIGTDFYTVEVMQRNDLWTPLFWTMAQSLFYDTKTPWEFLEQFCNEYFGSENGKIVFSFYKDLTASARRMERRIYGGLESTSAIMTDSLINQYRAPLRNAFSRLKDSPERRRMERFYNAFEIAAITAELYRAHCKALNNRDDESIFDVKRIYQSYKEFWPKVKPYQSPGDEKLVDPINEIDYKPLTSKHNEKMDDENEYMKALFSGCKTPEPVKNLFRLPENWLFRVDPLLEGQKDNYAGENYDDSKGWNMISTWMDFEEQGYYEIGGQFWYRITFESPEFPKGEKVYLRIGAIDDSGDVYLNGKLVATSPSSENWDKSFEADVTGALKQGQKNTIVVRGYDAFGAGGLWRPSAIYTK